MVEQADGLRLAHEPLVQLLLGPQLLRQHLEGHYAAQGGVPRAVYDAHRPFAELVEDLVAPEAGHRPEKGYSV